MGIGKMISRVGAKAADTVARAASLSPEQLRDVERKREEYLQLKPDPMDPTAQKLTKRLLSASGIEIFHAYLEQLHELYVPVRDEQPFDSERNIRFFNITSWVTDKNENSLEKLVNVYEVLSGEHCNIALVFHRTHDATQVYLAVVNTWNADNNVDVRRYRHLLAGALAGNFPGAQWDDSEQSGKLPCLDDDVAYSVAAVSNVPTEKSEKFVSQTIEKLLDGIVPDTVEQDYTLILLATPIADVKERKTVLEGLYSALKPYESWSTQFTCNESNSIGSSATVSVNVGVSAGTQQSSSQGTGSSTGTTQSSGTSQGYTEGTGTSDTTGTQYTDTTGQSTGNSIGRSQSDSTAVGVNANASLGSKDIGSIGIGGSYTDTATVGEILTQTVSDSISHAQGSSLAHAVTNNVAHSINNTLGLAVNAANTITNAASKALNVGANFGLGFARTSNVTATIGKSESISQNFTNYSIKHALQLLESQMKRMDLGSALGMWDFAAYVLSEDQNIANNVAHFYLALTQGDGSFMSASAVNVWRGDMPEQDDAAQTIYSYLRDLRHPLFGLRPDVLEQGEDGEVSDFAAYPASVTATAILTGKELAYSLNFPKHSVPGLPVLECAGFGRSISTYDDAFTSGHEHFHIGHIFHMNHMEPTPVRLNKASLSAHTFITGSTGSGKSNTVYTILEEARRHHTTFLVIEPAKGEYKQVFGMDPDVNVYGTNPVMGALLRLNPFSFPSEIHILEHLDRLIEIFNVCWPMYAAMPAVLKQAVERAYEECGWDLMNSTNSYGERLCPTFDDVAQCVRSIIDDSEYDSDNKGAYKGSLLTRLQSLCNGINGLIFTSEQLDTEQLFNHNTIVDLSRVGSNETKSLIMGILVLQLQEHRMSEHVGMNAPIRHLTVLEEAHNLLRRTSPSASADGGDLRGASVEMLSNAIAEMRTYGEGFIIADQAPGLLDASVIRNTNTKIIMRLPDFSDRKLVGEAANLTEDQIIQLAKLPRGVAAIYQNEWVEPVLCKINRHDGGEAYTPAPSSLPSSDNQDKALKDTLLYSLMSKLLFGMDDRNDLLRMKEDVLASRLSTKVKIEFMDYLNADARNFEELSSTFGRFAYEFLDMEPIYQKARRYTQPKEWEEHLLEEIRPSLDDFSCEQVDRIIELMTREQVWRDAIYGEYLQRFMDFRSHIA